MTGRFVEDKNLWPAGKDSRQASPLLLADTQLAWGAVLFSNEPDGAKGVGSAVPSDIGRQSEMKRPEENVLQNRGAKKLIVGILEDEADTLTDLGQSARLDLYAIDPNAVIGVCCPR